MPIDIVPVCNLCDVCVLNDECQLMAAFPDCEGFRDGYEGPEYPDGDAYREWRRVVYGYEDRVD